MTTQRGGEQGTPLSLSQLAEAIDQALDRRELELARALIRLILHHRPRHLPTYRRLLAVTWAMERWDECAEWARRLLNGDPLSSAGWAAMARAWEARGETHLARARDGWRRAFELDPYSELMRAGVLRTHAQSATFTALNHGSLASLYLRGRHWHQARLLYGSLVQAMPDRSEFRIGLMLSSWQNGLAEEARQMAGALLAQNRNLLAAWLVLADVGDADDRAMAPGYLDAMDGDGEYVVEWLGPRFYRRNGPTARLTVSAAELTALRQVALASDGPASQQAGETET